MQIKSLNRAGFTLVEIMIVVAIIGLLAAIAIPNFVKARTTAQQNACINNLRQIDGAIQQWALEQRKGENDQVVLSEVLGYLKNAVVCPSAGVGASSADCYEVYTVANVPTCKIVPSTHKLLVSP